MNSKDTIVYDKTLVASFVDKGGRLALKKDVEAEILKLFEMKEHLDNEIIRLKELILQAGKSISPDFRGVIGDKIKITLKKIGDIYSYDRLKMPKEFLNEIKYYKVDSFKVRDYIKKEGKIPEGITENIREPKVIITKQNEEIKQLP